MDLPLYSACPPAPADPSYGVWLQPGAQRDYPHLTRQKLPTPSTRHRTCGCADLTCYLLPSCFQNLCATAPSSAGQLWVLISFVWTRHASYLISSNLTSSSQLDEWLFILRLWITLHSDWARPVLRDGVSLRLCSQILQQKIYKNFSYDREAARSWDLSW